MIPRRVIVNKL